jgi:hypothetical protein
VNYDKDRAEKLTERILANPNSPQAGVLINDLLAEYYRGYPLDNLRALLSNDSQRVVAIGAWIASELGAKGSPLLGDIARLIGHPEKGVRFSAIDCLLVWAGRSNNEELASVIRLISDPEPGVRWKAMDFLSRATREQLEAALSSLEASEPNSANVRGLRWLIESRASDPEEVKTVLQSPEGVLRRYGVAAARRMSKNNIEPLLYAASLSDPDVKNFAESQVGLL